jgi:uncharacterized protein YycO
MKRLLIPIIFVLAILTSPSLGQPAYGPPWGPTSPRPDDPVVAPAQQLPAGAILVSRYLEERKNTSPGFWNHLAIYVGNGWIVESVAGRGVIYTRYEEYLNRPKVRDVMYFRDSAAGQRAALRAQSMVGIPYRTISSIFLFPRADWRGLNCDSVIRNAASAAYGRNLQIRFPDDVYRYPQYFTHNPNEIR